MTMPSMSRFFVMAFLACLLMIAAASETRIAAQSCENVTDAQLVSNIYGKFRQHHSLADQLMHVNVVAVDRVIRLQGWVNGESDYDRAVDFVSDTRCVRLINVNLFESSEPATARLGKGGGCANGTKACGDICIPEGDSCNIAGKP